MTSALTHHGDVETVARSPALAVRVGLTAALLAAALTVCFVVLALLFPADAWRDIDAYAASFETIEVVQLVPVLLLAPVVVVLMACLHHLAAGTRRLWSHLAVTFAAIYATIIAINYVVQLYVVRLGIAEGEVEGLALLVMPNPRSVFVALEIAGYGFFALMALAAAAAVSVGRLERWIRYTLVVVGATGIAGMAGGLADQRLVMLTGFGLSLLAFLTATVLLAIHFRRLGRLASARPAPARTIGLH